MMNMRLFVGIPLPPSAAEALDTACRRLRPRLDGLRWAGRDSWHITIQFLGASSTEAFECVASSLSEVQFRAVPVRLEALGIFDRAGIFLIGVKLLPELAELQRLVLLATGRCGFVAEARNYQPHITLARAKGSGGRQSLRRLRREIIADAPAARALSTVEFTANEFLLYESFTSPEGSRYEVRRRFPFSVYNS